MTGEARHALRNWPGALDAGRHLDGFDHMIALIANLDAVIGPDVSAMHLAGALGRPGFATLPPGFPWYWAAEEARSLWYPSITVGIQPKFGQWDDTVFEARELLRQLADHPDAT
jgi:ADP-heptose:LPS heptosyltransferase